MHFGSLEQANAAPCSSKISSTWTSGAGSASERAEAPVVPAGGRRRTVSINVRIVAATSHDPTTAVADGMLREDLYYHLNVVPLEIPPCGLTATTSPELLNYYIDQLATTEGLPYRRFTVRRAEPTCATIRGLVTFRELKNVVHRCSSSAAATTSTRTRSAVPRRKSGTRAAVRFPLDSICRSRKPGSSSSAAIWNISFRETGGSMSKVAERVGLERTHLYRKIRALGIDPKRVTAGSD